MVNYWVVTDWKNKKIKKFKSKKKANKFVQKRDSFFGSRVWKEKEWEDIGKKRPLE